MAKLVMDGEATDKTSSDLVTVSEDVFFDRATGIGGPLFGLSRLL